MLSECTHAEVYTHALMMLDWYCIVCWAATIKAHLERPQRLHSRRANANEYSVKVISSSYSNTVRLKTQTAGACTDLWGGNAQNKIVLPHNPPPKIKLTFIIHYSKIITS